MKRQNWYFLFVVLLAVGLLVSACGGEDKEAAGEEQQSTNQVVNSPPAPTTPTPAPVVDEYKGGAVDLLVQDANTGITEEEFQEFFVPAVKKKYPDISMTLVKEGSLDKLIAAGTIPDLLASSNTILNRFIDAKYPEDLNPMIKRFNLDITRFEPSIIEGIQGLSGNGRMYGLPFSMNYGATLVNLDVLDKFGVEFPNDIITWDDLYEYAKRMTVMDGDIQYVGASPTSYLNMLKQHGTSNMDSKDENAVLTSSGHQEVFSFIKKFFDLPGFIIKDTHLHAGLAIMTAGYVGLSPDWIIPISNRIEGFSYEWDLIAYPVFKERPQYGNSVDFHMLTVNATGKNREAAYRVLQTLMSDEVLEELARHRRITPLKDPTIKGTYHQATGVFEGKNLKAIFTVAPAPLPDYSIWKSTTDGFANKVAEEIALKGKDINTAMREQEELANAKLKELKEAAK